MLYQVKMGGISVFHGGDSGYVSLKDYSSDVAIVPVGRMSPTASPEKAFQMVSDIKPKVAVTMHGSDKQKQQFELKGKRRIATNNRHNHAIFHGKNCNTLEKAIRVHLASFLFYLSFFGAQAK